ncbi:uncharacterized protein VTP21DRAFT_5117 [Calcarisporiella thermophila]|uniref:uncharacterized protein n=1 Tax=Calcarisporiella thermophila TaxID=911321 RepID=UPI00374384B2
MADVTRQESAAKLEKFLTKRPEASDLVERNVLKDTHVAPSLQSHAVELERNRLSDELDHKLEKRPDPKELVERNILYENEVPGK